MVIINTSAVDVSIHAVSPELICAFVIFDGAEVDGAGGVAGVAAGASGAFVSTAVVVDAGFASSAWLRPMLPTAKSSPKVYNNFFIEFSFTARPRRFRRCGCGLHVAGHRRKSSHRQSCRYWQIFRLLQ